LYWETLSRVADYQFECMTGDGKKDYVTYVIEYIRENIGTENLRGLSLGCVEMGSPEMMFVQTGYFARFDVMDVAEGLIERKKTVSPTSTASPVQVTGRVVQDGTPVGRDVIVELEYQDSLTMTVATDDEGVYVLGPVPLYGTFSVVFARAWNEQFSSAGSVAGWAWWDGFAPSGGVTITLPDLEIGLQGFEQVAPAADASVQAGGISYQTPLTFTWSSYPGATYYWVDLGREGETKPVWQSFLTHSTSFPFYGILKGGAPVSAGAYWWAVGAQKQVGVYQLTVYGHPRSLILK